MSEKSKINAEIIRSKRKSLALQISDDGHLIVRVPLRCTNKDIINFIERNAEWIDIHTEKV